VALRSIQIENFRCVEHARLDLHPDLTLIHGPNGSGKSSLLEAIFLLGRGRSFRTTHLETAIRRGSDQLRVVGEISTGGGGHFPIGIEARARQTTARVAGEPARSLASLSTAFPVQVIEPGVHKLIEEGPVRRRRYLDWGVFHVEPQYLDHWQRFHKVVRQRNAALRAHAAESELDAWDLQFLAAGEEVTRARQSYLHELAPFIAATVNQLLGESVELSYSTGWKADQSLANALQESRCRDRQRKTSLVGPQRADLVVRSGKGLAKDSVSRGQQKLLASALILGQLAFHAQRYGMKPTLLLDDPAAELDPTKLERLVEQVLQLGVQVIVTSIRREVAALGPLGVAFHVEQGTVTRV
jgi:DNA replication and repair protein RecF